MSISQYNKLIVATVVPAIVSSYDCLFFAAMCKGIRIVMKKFENVDQNAESAN